MDNYPPGVTGNEPQITGEWPCDECDGVGGWMEEEGGATCALCKGTGIYPEDAWPLSEIYKEIRDVFKKNGWGDVQFDENDEYLGIYTEFRIIGQSAVQR